jgi:ribonuclease BN (tRNA processing enzyme)
VHLAEVPANVTFHDAETEGWALGGANVLAMPILHPGPTVGYRIEDGGRVLTYLTDHEPALGADLATVGPEWISGHALAHGADVLIHDCQYTEDEYEDHRGWGHSSTAHVATFAERAGAERLLLFHHDPLHTDEDLDLILDRVREVWDVDGDRCGIAAEGMAFDV